MLVDSYHASVDGRVGNRMTAAAAGGYADVVAFLLSRRATISARVRRGRTAMIAAAVGGIRIFWTSCGKLVLMLTE
ncbi:hypothetical protein F4678DRAFT_295908 [Xylaria arbuscula]|nr:hypothetical protein F4678DRAFT_295908 [Xylaria arbuscula]